MAFDMITDTPVMIDNKIHQVRFENGMTGIGSRTFWIDGKEFFHGAVRQSGDLTLGNHFLYLIKWRDTPIDKIYIFIHEDELPELLHKDQAWREPKKIDLIKKEDSK